MPSTVSTTGQQDWDIERDVVVLGSGAAGLTAAAVAATEGLEVLVVEKSRWIGGTTAISGGAIWIPDPAAARAMAIEDSHEKVNAYLDSTVGDRVSDEMKQAFLETGPEMLAYMQRRTWLRVARNPGSPDYLSSRPGAADGGRRVDPLPFDGRLLGHHFDELRPPLPEFMLFGGMMVSASDVGLLLKAMTSAKGFFHAGQLVLRYARDRLSLWRRGTRLVIGNALAARLFRSILDLGVPYWLDSRAEHLIIQDGVVVGVAVARGGQNIRVRARRGVVLATGGFSASEELRRRFLPEFNNSVSVAPLENTGDGVTMGEAVGGALGERGRTGGFWAPSSLRRRDDGSLAVYPHFFWDRAKPGLLAVRRDGRRFVNEARSYQEFVMAMAAGNDPGREGEAFLICDRPFIDCWGLGIAKPGRWPRRRLIEQGYLVEAPTLAALAERLGIHAPSLAETVARLNADAALGLDTEYGRGDEAYGRSLGDPARKPNPCVGPVAVPPYYAVKVVPGVIATSQGLTTNRHGQVLSRTGAPIAGLFACGNDMDSLMAGEYPAPGITLGPAMTFAYAAARFIASTGVPARSKACMESAV